MAVHVIMTVDAKTWYDWSEGAGLGLMLAAIFSLPGYQIDWRLVLLCDLSCLALGTTLNLYTGVKALRRVNVVAMIVLMVGSRRGCGGGREGGWVGCNGRLKMC